MPQTADIKNVLSTLVQFDTVSHNSNRAFIDWVCNFMSWPNITCERVKGEKPDKENVIITLGTLNSPPLLLSGHSDVVPVDGQDWQHHPFKLTEESGLWYGRGTTDMKGFIAVALCFIRNSSESPPPFPIQLVISHDEEVGCVGVLTAIEKINQQRHKPFLCIVGEPTNMSVVRQHKSKIVARATAIGKGGHSSNPDGGLNAIDPAVTLYNELHQLQIEHHSPERLDDRFIPNYSTFFCGRFDGGVILNIIPEKCFFDFEIRGLPHLNTNTLLEPMIEKAEVIDKELKERLASASCTIEVQSNTPGLSTDDSEPMLHLCLDVLSQQESHSVSYATEAGHFSAIGIPTLIIGPGDIKNAHIPDEFIHPDQLDDCYEFLTDLVIKLTETKGSSLL